jgi:hypothetical protein
LPKAWAQRLDIGVRCRRHDRRRAPLERMVQGGRCLQVVNATKCVPGPPDGEATQRIPVPYRDLEPVEFVLSGILDDHRPRPTDTGDVRALPIVPRKPGARIGW